MALQEVQYITIDVVNLRHLIQHNICTIDNVRETVNDLLSCYSAPIWSNVDIQLHYTDMYETSLRQVNGDRQCMIMDDEMGQMILADYNEHETDEECDNTQENEPLIKKYNPDPLDMYDSDTGSTNSDSIENGSHTSQFVAACQVGDEQQAAHDSELVRRYGLFVHVALHNVYCPTSSVQHINALLRLLPNEHGRIQSVCTMPAAIDD